MNTSYTSPESFFTNTDNEVSDDTSNDIKEANKILQTAVQDPVFDKMTDSQVTNYVMAGMVTAFICMFVVTYVLAMALGFAALALGLPVYLQIIFACIPSLLSIIYVDKVLRYFAMPIVAKSMVFYAKAVVKIKSFFSKK